MNSGNSTGLMEGGPSRLTTGKEHLSYIDSSIKPLCRACPNLQSIAKAKEKYSFTPNAMKAATRKRCTKTDNIGHLKDDSAIVSLDHLDFVAATTTPSGCMQ